MRGHLLKYQALLLGTPNVILKICQTPNSTTLMPIPNLESPLCLCVETIEQIYSSRLDPKDEPLLNLDAEWFTDGSSFI